MIPDFYFSGDGVNGVMVGAGQIIQVGEYRKGQVQRAKRQYVQENAYFPTACCATASGPTATLGTYILFVFL